MFRYMAICGALLLALSACETIKGAGRDIHSGGEALERAVN
jgi:predicted small secreted protein